MTDISPKSRQEIDMAIKQLIEDDRNGDTAVIDGLVMAAAAIRMGYPVDDATRDALRQRLKACRMSLYACDILSPP